MVKSRLLPRWLVLPFVVLASSVCGAHDASPSVAFEPPFQGLVVPSDSGHQLNFFGENLTVKVEPARTAGAYAVVEVRSPPGGGSPLHTHTEEDEI